MEIEKVIEHKKTGAWFSESKKYISKCPTPQSRRSFASVQVVEQLKDAASLLGRNVWNDTLRSLFVSARVLCADSTDFFLYCCSYLTLSTPSAFVSTLSRS
jgi:hypothetical protein